MEDWGTEACAAVGLPGGMRERIHSIYPELRSGTGIIAVGLAVHDGESAARSRRGARELDARASAASSAAGDGLQTAPSETRWKASLLEGHKCARRWRRLTEELQWLMRWIARA